MATLVLTVIGDDRSGLVESLAAVVARHGGNWSRSSMARLGMKFAGIVEVSVDDGRTDALIDELETPAAALQLEVRVERIDDSAQIEAIGAERERWEMELVGQDRPGIVHEISQVLARRNVSIEEMQTSTSSAPMSGESLFNASAVLVAVGPVDPDAVATDLEALANELMVDIELNT